MKVSDAYPSKYVKSADLQGQRAKLQISAAKMEEVAEHEPVKPVLYFNGKQKGVVLNKTNATGLALVFGEEMDNWGGKWIELMALPTSYQGKTVLGLVTMPLLTEGQVSPATPQQAGGIGGHDGPSGPHDFGGKPELIYPDQTLEEEIKATAAEIDDEIPF
jgi:hypothetical protein